MIVHAKTQLPETLKDEHDTNTAILPEGYKSDWSFTLEPGQTNIDFAVGSTSGDYKFNGQSAGVKGNFKSYDSHKNYTNLDFGLSDQANHYFLTAKNENNGLIITGGILHDKREQTPNKSGNKFRFEKGGLSPTLMAGKQVDFRVGIRSKIVVQVKAGVFINLDNIAVDLKNSSISTYTNTGSGRAYAGGGFVAVTGVAYSFKMSKSWSTSLGINGIFMTGVAQTNINETDSNGVIENGTLNIRYSSISVGPSFSVTLRR